ncbi:MULTISPECIES: Crp/Fnr family transcriptional regulator [Olivibacter]|jgi:CRP-like cAMP-binding protein|uniref:Crp/Fnr family transcriptional regulator n=1 Tax=Olivibacter jilunii TaxID=985016 RepID=A0ABW6AYG6_9SPHI|nr:MULTISPECIES: Crp/Fnr family transcriptional regulator [unclassified Olivibacter]MDM8172857.1 Crp/Fnr family transcriptional regulator [Olivibacter sp. 47]QEL02725.1 Crp/Fnr family transcriptional regulator [Olivibacter sp. LS-1]
MYDAFFDYLSKFSSEPLSDDDKALIRRTFIPSKLRKRQFMLQAGDQCKYFAFIVKGAMRMYSVDDKGTEHIVRLGVENWWMGDMESFVMFLPSPYHIEAWEHCELLYITREGAIDLQKKVLAFCEMKQQLDERNHMANNRRLASAISATAAKRYTDFIECYPELYKRFPQHILASYLGINKDTLSRVKRQRYQK